MAKAKEKIEYDRKKQRVGNEVLGSRHQEEILGEVQF